MKSFELQKWLGKMIAQPLQDDELLGPFSPFGTETQKECACHIASSATLQPFERVQIYHQQYWWRLIKCLTENFPTLARLFGKQEFQRTIAIPYLKQHPPTSWALAKLGCGLAQWLETHYQQSDRYLVITAARIDFATAKAFWISSAPKPDFSKGPMEDSLSLKLALQPHLTLFALEGDFFTFREQLLAQDQEYYNTNPFPDMSYGKHYFLLYRTPKNMVTWKTLAQTEFWVLSQFEKGTTIEHVCSQLEEEAAEMAEEAFAQIPFWFKEWTVLEWFRLLSS